MPDCFISYSSDDERFAKYIAGELEEQGLKTFLASESLQPGDDWSEKIKANLTRSNWVILLASRSACQSTWVQQELGMAIGGSKELVPVVWDMPPTDLPGWAPESQALDLRDADADTIRRQVVELANRIRSNKQNGLLIGAILAGGLVLLGQGGGGA